MVLNPVEHTHTNAVLHFELKKKKSTVSLHDRKNNNAVIKNSVNFYMFPGRTVKNMWMSKIIIFILGELYRI